MDYYEIIMKLIGRVNPIGETQEDAKRFENLRELTNLVNKLVITIDEVGQMKNRHEFSMQKAGKYADNFLEKELGISN